MGTCSSKDGLAFGNLCKPGIIWHAELIKKSTIEAKAKNDEQLPYLSGRICSNGASNNACLFTQQGRKAVNQDAMLIWEDFGSMKGMVFCGVFDGHGPYGHLVAKEIRDSLPSKLFAQWRAASLSVKQGAIAAVLPADIKGDRFINARKTEDLDHSFKMLEACCGNGKVDNSPEAQKCNQLSQSTNAFSLWKESHIKAFKVVDKELKIDLALDCFCSGSTAVTVVKQEQDLIIANVGDSRAIMATRDGASGNLIAVQLTEDLKPNLPEEQERIRRCGGRVFALKDEPDTYRVWLPYDDSPGLAMARSFGDFCLKEYGVISIPKVTYRRVTNSDLFIVLATDGVWDVLSNQEAINIVASVSTRTAAAKTLAEAAVCAWKLKRPSRKVDDCAVVCLYLDSPSGKTMVTQRE